MSSIAKGGKIQQYNPANDRFNIMLLQTLLYKRTSGTFKKVNNHPLYSKRKIRDPFPSRIPFTTTTQTAPRAQVPAPTPLSYANVVSKTISSVPLSTIATLSGTTWSLNGDTTISTNQTLIIPAGYELVTTGSLSTTGLLPNNYYYFASNYSLTNNGNIINNGIITVSPTEIFGKNSIVNRAGAIITNNGTINNGGAIVNSGTILGNKILNTGIGSVINL